MEAGHGRPSSGAARAIIPNWLIPENFGETAVLAGAVAYGVTYFACVRFYSGFGIEPADVGLGYADMLGQAAVYLAVAVTYAAIPMYMLARFVSRTARPGSVARRTARILQFVFVLVVPIYGLTSSAINGAGAVRDGEAISGFFGLLPWADAKVATINWVGSASSPTIPSCVIRLGEAAGTEIFYDPESRQTIRFPQPSIAVTIKSEADNCPV